MQAPHNTHKPRLIYQGDLYWANPLKSTGPIQQILHPHVVLQENLFNHSRIDSVVVCALTTNNKKATEPGNVVIEVGEGELEKRSIVVVSQINTLPKNQLGSYIGSLSNERVQQILAGIRFQQNSYASQ